jgi:ABC-type antimicrobial peptide transport system permease subunit
VDPRAARLWTYYVRLAHGAADLAAFDSRLRALGVRPRQFVLLALARALLVAVAGAAGAVLAALLASPLTPVGEARLAVPRSRPTSAATARPARRIGVNGPLLASLRRDPAIAQLNFPLLFAIALSVFGAATLLHLLLVSRARRRAETGLLKALGFVRRQVAAAFCWQATAVAVAGAVIGGPAGIAAGRLLWRVFATNFGVIPVAVTDPVLTVALAAAVLAAANLLAVVPALLAARPRPAVLLRSR